MMASEPTSSPAVHPERPRLVINGVPIQPEDLCRALSASVQHQLSLAPVRIHRASRPRRAPRAEPSPATGRASWALGSLCLMGGLVLTLWMLWR